MLKPLNEYTRVIPKENFCDVCRCEKAPFYCTLYFIHVCSLACYDLFESRLNEETHKIATMKLVPDEANKKENSER